jgi:excisionase family DNA binding protein
MPMTAADASDRLLTVPELASRWQVAERTILRLIKRGALRHVRIGRQIRFRPDEVLEFEKRSAPNVR